ncbi:MAG TPA: hypothetical protein VF846_01925 [Thermoanaerobaculia bacterium]
MTPADPFVFAARIGAILSSLGIRYVVGGSVAAMIYGEPRMTTDLDIVVDADEKQVRALVAYLKDEYYIEEEDALQAVKYGSSFNAIHFEASLKIDFFVAEKRAAVREQFARARMVLLPEGVACFYAPEDILIRKLLWFRLGGEQSERQWRDIIGIIRLIDEPLDDVYLDRAAASFEVTDLLARAREAAA